MWIAELLVAVCVVAWSLFALWAERQNQMNQQRQQQQQQHQEPELKPACSCVIRVVQGLHGASILLFVVFAMANGPPVPQAVFSGVVFLIDIMALLYGLLDLPRAVAVALAWPLVMIIWPCGLVLLDPEMRTVSFLVPPGLAGFFVLLPVSPGGSLFPVLYSLVYLVSTVVVGCATDSRVDLDFIFHEICPLGMLLVPVCYTFLCRKGLGGIGTTKQIRGLQTVIQEMTTDSIQTPTGSDGQASLRQALVRRVRTPVNALVHTMTLLRDSEPPQHMLGLLGCMEECVSQIRDTLDTIELLHNNKFDSPETDCRSSNAVSMLGRIFEEAESSLWLSSNDIKSSSMPTIRCSSRASTIPHTLTFPGIVDVSQKEEEIEQKSIWAQFCERSVGEVVGQYEFSDCSKPSTKSTLSTQVSDSCGSLAASPRVSSPKEASPDSNMLSGERMSALELSSPCHPALHTPFDFGVLFADDHMINRMLTGKVLRSAGFKSVHLAADGACAFDMWKNEVGINIVILDHDSCEMNGIDIGASMLAHIKKYCPLRTPPVLILQTAYFDDKSMAVAKAAGFYCCISKPIDQTALVETISMGWADSQNRGGKLSHSEPWGLKRISISKPI